MMDKLVSIIMPVYNAESFAGEAIESVLDQSYGNWELIIINDGSVDKSAEIIKSFSDARIRYFEQENKGVSTARNVGLKHITGDYFCFLDSDDLLSVDSLVSRLDVFNQDDRIMFVDGCVRKFSSDDTPIGEVWKPSLKGIPVSDLVVLGGKSFFGPSWMVRRTALTIQQFHIGLTHGEDLLFYLELALPGGLYDFAENVILNHRVHSASAMNNLDGLKRGYHYIYSVLGSKSDISVKDIKTYKKKVNRILLRSYLKRGELFKAIKSLI